MEEARQFYDLVKGVLLTSMGLFSFHILEAEVEPVHRVRRRKRWRGSEVLAAGSADREDQ